MIVARYTNGPRPLSIFLVGVPLRALAGLLFGYLLRVTKVPPVLPTRRAIREPRRQPLHCSARP